MQWLMMRLSVRDQTLCVLTPPEYGGKYTQSLGMGALGTGRAVAGPVPGSWVSAQAVSWDASGWGVRGRCGPRGRPGRGHVIGQMTVSRRCRGGPGGPIVGVC